MTGFEMTGPAMTGPAMRYVCLFLFLIGCSEPHATPNRGANLKGTTVVPDFMFLEAQDRPLRKKDLENKVWICSFIFTSCPTHCVEMSKAMKALQGEFEKESDFRIVAVTVDPARDTPEQLRYFGKQYEANPDRWYFLTGNRKDIVEFANTGIKAGVDPKDPLVHSLYFSLVDKKGVIRDVYHAREKDRMKQLRTDIRTLLAEK